MNKEINILVVEDDFLIGEVISQALVKAGYAHIFMADSMPSAIEMIEKHRPTLVLTDINFETKENGIDLGHLLFTKYKIPFIYITSHASATIVEKAKHTRPCAFIIKPFKNEDVVVAVDLALFNSQSESENLGHQISVKAGGAILNINAEDITWIESDGNYSTINLKDDIRKVVRVPLTELLEELAGGSFLRIHKSYIINKKFITANKFGSVFIREVELPVGRTYQQFITDSFKH